MWEVAHVLFSVVVQQLNELWKNKVVVFELVKFGASKLSVVTK